MSRREAKRVAATLEEPVREAAALARRMGLEPYPVNYWIVDHDEMNALIAYDGFQHRYPHWRWGMKYDQQRKQRQFLGGKAFEIVNNDHPAHAFLQESNELADQKAVITHVEAHADFFRNNQWFGLFAEEPDAAAMLERHAETVSEYMADPEVDREAVEAWIDNALCLEDVIDQHQPFTPVGDGVAETPEVADIDDRLEDLEFSEEVKHEVFDEEWLEAQRDDEDGVAFPPRPEKDLLAFLRTHGKRYDDEAEKAVEFDDWQRELLEIVRREAYYFAPQQMTKVMNEGWACVAPDTPVFTAEGLVPMSDVVETHPPVSDGETARAVYDSNVIPDHDTVTIETRRGFELTGSNNHRVRRPDGSWVRLDELAPGDEIAASGGNGIWPDSCPRIHWDPDEYVTLDDIADRASVSVWTVMRYRRTGRAERADAIESTLAPFDGDRPGRATRTPIRIPDRVTEQLGRFLGLLVGDGRVSSSDGRVGFTSGTRVRAAAFAGLLDELFGLEASVERDESRWRVDADADHLVAFLTDGLGLPDGTAATEKRVPELVCRSPSSVVAAFLSGLFDADGHAGEQGVVLRTESEQLGSTVQLLLANFGALAGRRERADGRYHVHLTGRAAEVFAAEIGFVDRAKADALEAYLDDLGRVEAEPWTDEVVAIEEGTGTVYDVSVAETHRYAAAGLVNHNSYWESTMMTGEVFAGDDEVISYADHMARVLGSPGMNPYKLGKELWEYVENLTNRREVIERLLRVEGVTWRNFDDVVDLEAVRELLEPDAMVDVVRPETLDGLDPDDPRVDAEALERARAGEIDVEAYPWKVLTYEGLCERHYSLVEPQNRGFLSRIGQEELERISRYLFEADRYATVEAAIADVDYTAGWDRMREIRESHNDVTFLDEFLTQEFVDENDYFTYEYTYTTGDYRVTSTDYRDVKKKLMLRFTNFGKPTIAVHDANHENRNELLLGHHYNGVMLDVDQAKQVLERVFELWGRPVNLLTIVKELDEHDVEVARRRDREPEPTEQGKLVRYDGEDVTVEDVDWEAVEHLAADDVDYDTKPEEWLA